jgi:hypothetical protein
MAIPNDGKWHLQHHCVLKDGRKGTCWKAAHPKSGKVRTVIRAGLPGGKEHPAKPPKYEAFKGHEHGVGPRPEKIPMKGPPKEAEIREWIESEGMEAVINEMSRGLVQSLNQVGKNTCWKRHSETHSAYPEDGKPGMFHMAGVKRHPKAIAGNLADYPEMYADAGYKLPKKMNSVIAHVAIRAHGFAALADNTPTMSMFHGGHSDVQVRPYVLRHADGGEVHLVNTDGRDEVHAHNDAPSVHALSDSVAAMNAKLAEKKHGKSVGESVVNEIAWAEPKVKGAMVYVPHKAWYDWRDGQGDKDAADMKVSKNYLEVMADSVAGRGNARVHPHTYQHPQTGEDHHAVEFRNADHAADFIDKLKRSGLKGDIPWHYVGESVKESDTHTKVHQTGEAVLDAHYKLMQAGVRLHNTKSRENGIEHGHADAVMADAVMDYNAAKKAHGEGADKIHPRAEDAAAHHRAHLFIIPAYGSK